MGPGCVLKVPIKAKESNYYRTSNNSSVFSAAHLYSTDAAICLETAATNSCLSPCHELVILFNLREDQLFEQPASTLE